MRSGARRLLLQTMATSRRPTRPLTGGTTTPSIDPVMASVSRDFPISAKYVTTITRRHHPLPYHGSWL
jgi:hypothetical protein